jgi:hypothetical protein
LIVKLQTAVTALKQSPAEQPVHEVGGRRIHLVDLVRRLTQGHTIAAAGWASGMFAMVDQKPPSGTLALSALAAFENIAAGQFLRKGSMHPKQHSPAMSTDFQAPDGHVISLWRPQRTRKAIGNVALILRENNII